MMEFTIPRTGKPPLRFTGEILARVDGERAGGREHNRWHEVAVYRTAGETYAVAIGYRTRWQGELDHLAAETCRDPAEVNRIVQAYDPAAHVQGYPPGDAYAEKQARLLADVRRRYAALATEVYEQLGAEFVEVIP